MYRSIAAAALALASLSGHAAPEYAGHFGTNPDPITATHGFLDVFQSPLDHAYVFELQGPHHAAARGFVTDPGDRFDAVGTMLSLWRSNGDMDFGNDELIGGFDFGEQAVAQRFEALGSGEYFWRLESLVTGSDGLIVFEFDLTPVASVPEPGTLALLAAGLSGVLAVARRRRPR